MMMDRNGFALPTVLFALLLIAVLIAGAFSATTEETRMGVAAARRQTALVTAESAIELTLATLSSSVDDPIEIGETRLRQIDGLDMPAAVYVTRLDSALYWLVADAGVTSSNSGVSRRVGVLVRTANSARHSIAIDRIPERAWSELF